ncbi:MAG: Hpt domain-containing protein [Rhodoferax sp.]
MAASLTDGVSPQIRARFLLLQRRFVAGLPGRWLEIRDAADGQSRLAALHRLAGSAGSYGLEGIGQCARDAEALALQGDSAALTRALRALEGEIGRVQGA